VQNEARVLWRRRDRLPWHKPMGHSAFRQYLGSVSSDRCAGSVPGGDLWRPDHSHTLFLDFRIFWKMETGITILKFGKTQFIEMHAAPKIKNIACTWRRHSESLIGGAARTPATDPYFRGAGRDGVCPKGSPEPYHCPQVMATEAAWTRTSTARKATTR